MCDTSYVPGVIVYLKTADGNPLEGDITAIAFDDSYIDTLDVSNYFETDTIISVAGLHERAGRYSLLVASDLYKPISRTDIIVLGGKCHVRTVHLDFVLEPK
jgi:hypothetical protein